MGRKTSTSSLFSPIRRGHANFRPLFGTKADYRRPAHRRRESQPPEAMPSCASTFRSPPIVRRVTTRLTEGCLSAPTRKAPIYHGVVALLKAVTYLESRPEVDRNRIGMAGASWGGFFTTLMVGIDPRLKVGSSLYGCGSLQLGNAWWDGVSRSSQEPIGPAERERCARPSIPHGDCREVKRQSAGLPARTTRSTRCPPL